jgi:hypothetical protein
LILDGVVNLLNETTLQLGREFSVLVVSFDPLETAADAADAWVKFNERLIGDAARGREAFRFLVGSDDDVTGLMRELGFKYLREGKDFAHSAAVMILTPTGEISQYFTGIQFSPWDVRLSLIEASHMLSLLHRVDAGESVRSVLESLEPGHRGYRELREALGRQIDSMDLRPYTVLAYPQKDSMKFIRQLQTRLFESGYIGFNNRAADSATLAKAISNPDNSIPFLHLFLAVVKGSSSLSISPENVPKRSVSRVGAVNQLIAKNSLIIGPITFSFP